MKRNVIAVICLILVATLVFVGCSKQKTFVDVEGKTHVAYTDENGETVTDENGDVYVVPTQEDGSPATEEDGSIITQIAENQKIFVSKDGKHIDTRVYSYDIPDGWVIKSTEDGVILRKAEGDSTATINIDYRKESKEDAMLEFEKGMEELDEYTTGEPIYEEREVEIDNANISDVTEITIIRELIASEEKTIMLYVKVYIFRAGDFTYGVSSVANSEEDMNSVDIIEVINSITYK